MLSPPKLFFVNMFTSCLPASRFFKLKSALYKWAGVIVGSNVRFMSSASILGVGELKIGDNTFIGHNTNIIVGGSYINIGKDVDISSSVTIINGTHQISKSKNKAAGIGYSQPISIGNGAWVGAGCTITGKSDIGECTIVGAGSLVCKKLLSNKTYIGSKITILE